MNATILLVDDDVSVRQSIAHLLDAEDFRVLSAANGTEAITILQTQPIDLILLDLNMPGKNGWETFQHISFDPPAVPVIIITARPNQLFPALAAGAAALMEKPLDFPKLLRTIRDLIAEPESVRCARTAGKSAQFHYLPAHAT